MGSFWKSNAPGSDSEEWENEAQRVIRTTPQIGGD